jgi:hypothetical protein
MQDVFQKKYNVQIYTPMTTEMDEWKKLARSVWRKVSVDKLEQLRKETGSR